MFLVLFGLWYVDLPFNFLTFYQFIFIVIINLLVWLHLKLQHVKRWRALSPLPLFWKPRRMPDVLFLAGWILTPHSIVKAAHLSPLDASVPKIISGCCTSMDYSSCSSCVYSCDEERHAWIVLQYLKRKLCLVTKWSQILLKYQIELLGIVMWQLTIIGRSEEARNCAVWCSICAKTHGYAVCYR